MLQSDNFFKNDFDFVKLTDAKTLMHSKVELKVEIFLKFKKYKNKMIFHYHRV